VCSQQIVLGDWIEGGREGSGELCVDSKLC